MVQIIGNAANFPILLKGCMDVVEQKLTAQESPYWVFRLASAIAHETWTPAAEMTETARLFAPQTRALNPSEVRHEIEQMLLGRSVDLALEWFHQVGLLAIWLPELEVTVNFSQEAGRRHKDVWQHTKQVVKQSVKRPVVRWGALLHDIGKVKTRTFTPDGKVHFHGHSELGAKMFRPIAERFQFAPEMRKEIKFLIYHHLRPNQYEPGWTDAAVRRFARELAEHLDDLLDLSRADITSARPGKRESALRNISELAARIEKLRAEDAIQPPLPTGIGDVMMQHFGLPPSRQIGDLKRALEQAIETGELEPHHQAEYYLAYVAKLLGR